MSGITVHEFDLLVPHSKNSGALLSVPPTVFEWLAQQSLAAATMGTSWLRLTQHAGRRAIQVTNFVGTIQAPSGFQIEVLPKIGRVNGNAIQARQTLIEMLCCLNTFRHLQTEHAKLQARHMRLLELFIAEYLNAVSRIVKRGLRGGYAARQDNLTTLRGKLQISRHLHKNLVRADRFFTEHDEFTTNRPEHRLIHLALRQCLSVSASQANQRLARELCFAFADVPLSATPLQDFQQVRLDRGMDSYPLALSWAKLIIGDLSPVTGQGAHIAPSLLFPMEAVFEAFVAKHLQRQLSPSCVLRQQISGNHLVEHNQQRWFRLKPDLLVIENRKNRLVLDTKWKLLDCGKSNRTEKYGIAQSDFYQMQSYGHSYLEGNGDVVLIYPRTEQFQKALPVFKFPNPQKLRVWVLPFCLKQRRLLVPEDAPFKALFS